MNHYYNNKQSINKSFKLLLSVHYIPGSLLNALHVLSNLSS